MSTILLVGAPDEFGPNLYEHLKSIGHRVLSCTQTMEALKLVQNETVDLTVASSHLPEGKGTDFFNQLKEEGYSSSFILLAENFTLTDAQKAYELGIDEIISKPLDLEILKLVIDYFFKTADSVGSQDDRYFSIPIDDLLVSSRSNYSIYLKINNKYVCVTKTGQEFTHQRLQHLKSKDIKFIYLTSNDYSKYTDLQFSIAASIHTRPLDNAKLAKTYNHLIQTISQNTFINQINHETLSRAVKAFENYTKMAFNNSQIRTLLMAYTNESPNLAERSSILATVSSSIAHMWHWNSPKIQSRIVLGALMCDIGLKDYPHLHTKPRADFSKDELAIFEEHPLRSYKMLSDIDGLPDEVLKIALQHHENGVGHGFPQKLPRSQVHSFAKLVNGTNEFIDVLYSQKDKTDTKAALDKLFVHQRKMMSEQVLKSLYKLFNHTVPRELDGLLLPDEAARVF